MNWSKREGVLKDVPEEKLREIEVRLSARWKELEHALEHAVDLAGDL
jgi:hypothetical protein